MANVQLDIFNSHYSELCSTLTDIKKLLPSFVQARIINTDDLAEINAVDTTGEKVMKLLSHISGPLEAGNTSGFHTMLTIMKEHGNQATKDLAVKISDETTSFNDTREQEVINDRHQVPSPITSSEQPPVEHPDQLSVHFSTFVTTIELLLSKEQCQDKLNQSKQFCSNLTCHSTSGNHKLLFNDEQLQKIKSCTTFSELFTILRRHWSWSDYSILKNIISITGIKKAKNEVKLFETTMASYQGMKIISQNIPPEEISSDYIRLSVLIDEPYQDLAAEKYTELHDFVFEHLDIKRYIALPFIKFLFSSLQLEWYVLKRAAPHMIKMAQQNEEMFLNNSVVFIQVDQTVVFDHRAKGEKQIEPTNFGGYDNDFVSPLPDRLECKICHLPCCEAQQSECCGQVYCKTDIDRLKANTTVQPTCPFCRSEEFVTHSNLSIDREIQQLMVYCPNKEMDRCDWVGKLKDVDKHYRHGKECETECDKCKEIVKHKLLHHHISTECPCYCPHCDITADKEVITGEHKEKCHKFPITCPNNCGMVDIPQDSMDEHREVCPCKMVQCEFHDIGCEVTFPRKDEEAHAKDSVATHLQLAQRRLISLNKLLEESNARHLESTDKFTEMLSDLQTRIRAFEIASSKNHSVNVGVQTDMIQNANVVQQKKIVKVIQYYNIIVLPIVIAALVMVMFNSYANYTKAATGIIPGAQEFHEKVSIVLYELIDRSELSWHQKLYYWSSITFVAPVVLKFSDLKVKSVLKSRTFFAFTNGFLMRLRIYPSGSPGVNFNGKYVSVYLDFLKGPYDDTLESLGYFPVTKTSFTIELLDPKGNFHFNVVKRVIPTAKRIIHDDAFTEYEFPQFISLGKYDFKQRCSCDRASPTICCYLTDDGALYFRVQESKID